MHIPGKKIVLRSVIPSDADILYKWENDRSNWDVSGTKKSFTKKEVKDFIAKQKDIYLDKQLRLMICTSPPLSGERGPGGAVGCIDLFEFDTKKAGIGILIEKKCRNKGYAAEALSLLIKYSFKTLNLKELFCSISVDNEASLRLFQKCKFKITSTEKNIHTLQLVNTSH